MGRWSWTDRLRTANGGATLLPWMAWQAAGSAGNRDFVQRPAGRRGRITPMDLQIALNGQSPQADKQWRSHRCWPIKQAPRCGSHDGRHRRPVEICPEHDAGQVGVRRFALGQSRGLFGAEFEATRRSAVPGQPLARCVGILMGMDGLDFPIPRRAAGDGHDHRSALRKFEGGRTGCRGLKEAGVRNARHACQHPAHQRHPDGASQLVAGEVQRQHQCGR